MREPQWRSLLLHGWIRAVKQSIIAALFVVALGEAVSFLLFATNAVPHESVAQAARQGLLLFYVFHRVTLEITTQAVQIPSVMNNMIGLPAGHEINATVGFALMGGTAIAIWLLARAGRAIGRGAGGTPAKRAIHGAKVAIPYAVLSYAASYHVELTQRLPRTSLLHITPSHPGALMWPLFLAAVFGAVGGFRSSDPGAAREWLEWRMTDRWIRMWRGAFAGAATTFLLLLGFGFVGLIVLAFVLPGAASAYFHTISSGGVTSGIAIGVLSALAIPNLAAWVALPAMGGCLEVGGGASSTNPPVPYCFLSYSNSLTHPLKTLSNDWDYLGFHELGAASSWYLLFLAVPVIAVFLGGVRGARVARVANTREVIIVSLLSAMTFTVLLVFTLTLSWVTLRTSGPVIAANDYIRYGPYPTDGAQAAFGWSLVVGGLGALWARRRLRRAAAAS